MRALVFILLTAVTAAGWGQKPIGRVYPASATAQLVLDPVQAEYPGNEHVKPCGPANHDNACVDGSLPHVTNHLYESGETCERNEGVPCTQDQAYWAPIGKPVFEACVVVLKSNPSPYPLCYPRLAAKTNALPEPIPSPPQRPTK